MKLLFKSREKLQFFEQCAMVARQVSFSLCFLFLGTSGDFFLLSVKEKAVEKVELIFLVAGRLQKQQKLLRDWKGRERGTLWAPISTRRCHIALTLVFLWQLFHKNGWRQRCDIAKLWEYQVEGKNNREFSKAGWMQNCKVTIRSHLHYCSCLLMREVSKAGKEQCGNSAVCELVSSVMWELSNAGT